MGNVPPTCVTRAPQSAFLPPSSGPWSPAATPWQAPNLCWTPTPQLLSTLAHVAVLTPAAGKLPTHHELGRLAAVRLKPRDQLFTASGTALAGGAAKGAVPSLVANVGTTTCGMYWTAAAQSG